MKFIDIHTHLALQGFDADRAEVLDRAKQAGAEKILVAGEDYEDNQRVLDVCEEHDILKPCLGFFPTNLEETDAEKVEQQIRENATHLVGISEVGLDYWKVKEEPEREKQRNNFKRFIDLSKELDKPLIVHSRSAGKPTIEFLIKNRAERVCLHAFDGRFVNAQLGVEAGFYFSIPPSIVRSDQKKKLVKQLPIENILLESDAPALGPMKEERNEPANVVIAIDEIARIKSMNNDEASNVLYANSKKFLN